MRPFVQVVPENNLEKKFTLNVLGPMARTAEDCVEMMKILADDPSKLQLDGHVDVASLRFFFCDNEGTTYVSAMRSDMRRQVHRVVDFLKNDLRSKQVNEL